MSWVRARAGRGAQRSHAVAALAGRNSGAPAAPSRGPLSASPLPTPFVDMYMCVVSSGARSSSAVESSVLLHARAATCMRVGMCREVRNYSLLE